MKCPQCGYQEEDDAAICSRCGKVLRSTGAGTEEAAPILDEAEQAALAARKGKRTKTLGMVLGGVVVAAAIAVGLSFVIHGPDAKLQGQWTASTYGGFLALLTPGLQLDITGETNGQVTGTINYTNGTQNITKGTVRGDHVALSTGTKTSYTYYVFNGTVSKDGKSLTGVARILHSKTSGQKPSKPDKETLHQVLSG